MEQFDYDVVDYYIEDKAKYLNDLRRAGREGWDLVSVIPLSTNMMQPGATTKIQATFKCRILPSGPRPHP